MCIIKYNLLQLDTNYFIIRNLELQSYLLLETNNTIYPGMLTSVVV